MVKVEKISVLQILAIIIVNRFLFGFSFMPTVSMAPANQDAWIVEIISGIVIYVSIIPLMIMSTRFRDKSYNEYLEIIIGKPLGRILGVAYAAYLLLIVLLTIMFLADFLLSAVYPETPLYFIVLFMLVPCMYATYKGVECIGRASIIFAILILLTIFLYFALNLNNMDFNYFLPMLTDSEPSELTFGVINNAFRFCDAFVVFTFMPYVNEDKKYPIFKFMAILVIVFTVMNVIVTISTQAVLSPTVAKMYRYPYFISVQQISLFDIIQRIDFFNVISWILIFFVKISSTILASAIILSKVFRTKSYKPFVIPLNLLAFIVVTMTNISNYAIFRTFINEIAYKIIFTANTGIPTIILMIYLLRRKKLNY